MTRLKILHVIGQRPEMTGSGIYLESIIRESRNHGFENYRVAGVPFGTHPPSNDAHQNDAAYVLFNTEPLDFSVPGMSDVMPYESSLFRELKGRRLTAYKKAFTKVLQTAFSRFQPDIIHTNHLFVLSALVRKLFPKIPIVTTCHGTDLRQYHNCIHLRRYVRRYCIRMDKIIALTADQKKNISRLYGLPPEKIAVIGSGYDETTFRRAPKPAAGTVQILYAGKYNRSKGVPWLLKSLMKIRHQDWHLHMAGSGKGPECAACLDLMEQLGPKVTNHGFISHERLAELMQKAHVQVLPSFFEGLPLVLFEGLASGCRIITTQLSGFDEIFGKARNDTIDLIPLPPLQSIDTPHQKDEANLENALSRSILNMMAIVKKKPDFEDEQAEQIASGYTWSHIFKKTRSVYHEVVAHKILTNSKGKDP